MKRQRIFLVVFIICSILFVSMPYVEAVSVSSTADNAIRSPKDYNQMSEITRNTAIVTQFIYLSDQYAIYGELSSTIVVEAELYFITQPGENPVLSIPYFGSLKAVRSPSYISYKYGIDVWGHQAVEFKIPKTTKYAKISVEYTEQNLLSIMYRNFMKLYYGTDTAKYTVLENLSPAYERYISFILPDDSEFLYGFPSAKGTIIRRTESEFSIKADANMYLYIAYQSKKLKIYSTLLSVPALLIFPFMFISKTQKFFGRQKRKITRSRIYSNFFSVIRQIQPLRFAVALYVLTAVLMFSLAISVGPNPNATIVIIADNFDEIAGFIHEKHPNVIIYHYWSIRSRLNQLRDAQQLDMFIIGYYPNPADFIVHDVLVTSSQGARAIILDQYVDSPLASAILEEYNKDRSGLDVHITSLTDLNGQVQRIYDGKQKLHRIYEPSSKLFNDACAIIAFLSLLHIYAAGMVITASATPPSTKSISEVFLQAIIVTFSIFSFTMISFFTVSKFLQIIVSVHGASGVVDNYPLTVIGYIPNLPPPFPSFGGGNILRAAFGTLGMITIILINHLKSIVRIDLVLFGCLLGALMVLAVSPYFGPFIIGMAVVFVASGIGPVAGAARFVAADISLFLLTFGRFIGVGEYSRGIMLFFASVPPLTIARKLSLRVRTPMFLIMIPILARGLMRLGEMNPYTLINSALPGLLFGMALAALFLMLNALVYAIFRTSIRVRQWVRSLDR
ncbi:MAG: hypothetical protein ACFFCD_05785 [Promethearchaeota archaeon]